MNCLRIGNLKLCPILCSVRPLKGHQRARESRKNLSRVPSPQDKRLHGRSGRLDVLTGELDFL
jgi:hypothetical protein